MLRVIPNINSINSISRVPSTPAPRTITSMQLYMPIRMNSIILEFFRILERKGELFVFFANVVRGEKVCIRCLSPLYSSLLTETRALVKLIETYRFFFPYMICKDILLSHMSFKDMKHSFLLVLGCCTAFNSSNKPYTIHTASRAWMI